MNVDPVAVAAELETVKREVSGLKRVLAPAFAPVPAPIRGNMATGPGEYRPEPYRMAQASSRSGDIWAGDIEHSESYMDAIRRGVNVGELRRQSAEDAMQRAIAHQPSSLIWESPACCGRDGCRPATQCPNCRGHSTVVRDEAAHIEPPRQVSVVHRDWAEFPDHAPIPPPNRQPGAVWAREQAAAMPPRQPETGEVLKGI